MGASTRKQLKRYLAERGDAKPHEPLFANEVNGRQMSLAGLVQLMERLRVRSGVTTCRAHSFRRTFALTCLRNGMNIYVLAKLMGHVDITVLKHYLALVEDDLREAHEKYGTMDHFGFSFGDERRIPSKSPGRQSVEAEGPRKRGRKPKNAGENEKVENLYAGNRPEEYDILMPKDEQRGGRCR